MAKILLVEDDTNLSEIYQARLEAEGYVVVAATDGETALALAAKEKPDLILSDVMMPKISGFEMLDILRNTDGLKHTKVIMLTALGQAEDRTRAEQLGADRYLVKSQVTLEDIVTAAHDLLNPDEASQTPIAALNQSSTPATPAPTPVAAAPVQPAPTGPLESTVPADTTPAPQPAVAPPAATEPAPASTPATSEPVAAAVDTPAPATPAAAPQPVVTPLAVVPEPPATPPAADTTPATPAMSPEMAALGEPAEAQTTAQETAEIADKIAGFAEEPAAAPAAVEPEPATEPADTAAPAPEPTPALESDSTATTTTTDEASANTASPSPDQPTVPPVTANSAAAIDENVVANAIDKLLAKTPGSSSSTTTVDTTAGNPAAPAEKVRKKIISPLEHGSAPSLQELLAKEEAKSTGTPGEAPTPQMPTGPPPPDTNPPKDPPSFDPSSVAL